MKLFWESYWEMGMVRTDYVGARSAIPEEGGVEQMRLPCLDGKVKYYYHSKNY